MLIASLFVYKLLCIFTPGQDFFSKYKTDIRKFIWTGYCNSATAVYDKVIRSYADRGLQLVDLETKNLALKCTWVKRTQNQNAQQTWAKFAPYFLLWHEVENLWKCNITSDDIKKITPKCFWQDVWISWVTFNKQEINTKIDVLNQTV